MHYDLLEPSKFAHRSQALSKFIHSAGLEGPPGDPLTALKHLNTTIYGAFEYAPGITEVHSPIDEALGARRGVSARISPIS